METKPLDPGQTARTKARYDRQAARYDTRTALMKRLASRQLRGRIWSLIGGPEVLEVGVGSGRVVAFSLIFLGIWMIFAGD